MRSRSRPRLKSGDDENRKAGVAAPALEFLDVKPARRVAARRANLESPMTMLLDQTADPVNSPPCEQPADNLGKTPRRDPARLVLRYGGRDGATVQPFLGHDVTFGFIMAQGAWGLREGDTIVLYSLHWSAPMWGRG